ncbi:hypothetical protein FACS1894217_02650 [Clostridia bacterium]|nr:hypothetical protein FACS1894217_02650 [Clostridia bacterium]
MNTNELVELRLFRDNGRYKSDLFVGVNGKTWRIKRGETVRVPSYVKEVVERQIEQDNRAAELMAQLSQIADNG